MRRILLLLLLSLTLPAPRVHADEYPVRVESVLYTIDTNTLTARIGGYNGTQETIEIPSAIDYNGKTYTVTTLGSFLNGDTIVRHVTLPGTITTINATSQPFQNCALEEIDMSHLTIGNNKLFNNLFLGCVNLKSIKMPQTSVPVGDYMCKGCSSLESITFYDETPSIGQYAFNGCTKLSETNLSELTQLKTIGDYAFQNTALSTELILPESLTTVGKYAFSGNAALPSLTLKSNLSKLSDYAFSKCTSLQELTIEGNIPTIGSNTFLQCTALKTVSLPATFTTIGSYMFNGCSALENINFPESLTTIGSYAFNGCFVLNNPTIPDSVSTLGSSAFSSCKAITSVDLSNTGITKILSSTFSGCSALESVKLPGAITEIGEKAFYNTPKLTTVEFPSTLTSIGQNAYQNSGITSVTFPEALTTVGTYAFSGCAALESADMSQSKVMVIDQYVFNECGALQTVLLPQNLTTINQYAFNKAGVKNLTFPESLTTLGITAFYSCPSLETVDMSQTQVTDIPENAFAYCSSLSHVDFPSGLVSIGKGSFLSTGFTSIDLPSTVTSIDQTAFQNCKSLATADLSKTGVTTIATSTFNGCSNLSSVQLPTALQKIYMYAFKGTALPSLMVPETLNYLGTYVFENCTALKSMDLSKTKITTIPNYVFSGCTALTTVSFPSTVTAFNSSAFLRCTKLATIDLSATKITTLGASAFSDLTALKTVKLPETVTSIGAKCFYNTAITAIVAGSNKAANGRVNLPSGIKTFPNTALDGCTKLQTLDLGALNIDPKFTYSTFTNFKALKKFVFPEKADLTAWTRSSNTTAFFPSTTNPLSVTLPSGEATPTIPNYFFYNINVGEVNFHEVPPTAIGNYAFYGNPLQGIAGEDGSTVFRIPDGVESIGNYAFSGTTYKHLLADSIRISGTLTSIGASAFSNAQCRVLYLEKQVTPDAEVMAHAPARVDSRSGDTPTLTIGSQAFSSSTGGPDQVLCLHTVPPTLPDNGFSTNQYTNGELIVNHLSANAYRAATGWENFSKTLITAIDEIEIDGDGDNVDINYNDGRTYNLQGIPVPADRPLAPGIYIRDGKKILIR